MTGFFWIVMPTFLFCLPFVCSARGGRRRVAAGWTRRCQPVWLKRQRLRWRRVLCAVFGKSLTFSSNGNQCRSFPRFFSISPIFIKQSPILLEPGIVFLYEPDGFINLQRVSLLTLPQLHSGRNGPESQWLFSSFRPLHRRLIPIIRFLRCSKIALGPLP